jgi:hypothetical protein
VKAIFALILSATAAPADTLQQADLAKLRDPARRDAEVARLAGCDENKKTLAGYHFLTAYQKAGQPPLHLLCAATDYHFEIDRSIYGGYAIDKPEELFGKIASQVSSRLEPDLEPIRDSQLLIFNSEGKEVRPFGGNNYTNEGYYFDFDHDGILDRADSTNYSLKEAPKHSVEVFELQTVEPEPRTLLKVIFNWHPRSAPESNEWTFTCFDENQDGIAEIAFGPKSASSGQEQRRFVFRMDPATKRYSAGDIPAHSHIQVMQSGETLASIAQSGGLGYPQIKDPSDPKIDGPPPVSPQAPYVFRSLKDRPATEFSAFFQGKSRRDSWSGPEDSFPNRLPERFWNLSPKQAAIALAEANRTPTHRAQWKLVLDDRDGIAPPKSGWLLHDWGSSSCYSYSSHLFALRFGVPDPSLLVFEYNSIGVVGRNPWADQPAHQVRVIKLSDQEARFLADTVFWLDRIRTFSGRKTDTNRFGSSSTADGSATICLFPDGAAPRELASETVWATSTISAGFDEQYTQTTFINLAEFLIGDSFPSTLGARWNMAEEIGRHSLVTPTEERLTPRVDEDARQKLSEAFADILRQHQVDPIPAAVLAKLAQAAGDEALTELLTNLRKLHAALPAPTAEDHEFAALQKRFERDHFGSPLGDDPTEHKKAYARLNELRDKREFLPSAILRNPLSDSITKLRLAGSAAELKAAVKENGPQSRWALNQFRRLDLTAWSELLAGQFANADVENRRTIFETLAAGNPPAAKEVIAKITPAEHRELILEIAGYHQKHDVGSVTKDLTVLMSLVRDKKQNYIRRGQAIDLLAKSILPTELLKDFTDLLIAEIKHPQQGEYGMSTLDSAITALTRLPDAEKHLELLTSIPVIVDQAYRAGLDALVQMAKDRPDRETLLAGFIHPRFQKSNGMMNDVFLDALAQDLHVLAPEIAAFATEGPSVQDGNGADYSGGNFKTPVGQRYHTAREVTALWAESDPVTLGRMWIYFVAVHPYPFDQSRQSPALRELAARLIAHIPKDRLPNEINSAIRLIPISKYHSSVELWLRELGR